MFPSLAVRLDNGGTGLGRARVSVVVMTLQRQQLTSDVFVKVRYLEVTFIALFQM